MCSRTSDSVAMSGSVTIDVTGYSVAKDDRGGDYIVSTSNWAAGVGVCALFASSVFADAQR